jgi:hypothetical protein
MAIPVLSTTTLTPALDGSTRRFAVGSTTGINGLGSLTAPQTALVIGGEVMLVQNVPVSGIVEVIRGQYGTAAKPHAASATVYFGAASRFSTNTVDGRVGLAAPDSALPVYTLPVGGRSIDHNTGYEYVLCDAGEAITAGQWVGISGAGLATVMTTGTKGRVGIAVEAAGTSDVLIWVLVVGTYASAVFDTDVTTACVLMAGAGIADISTTSGGNIIHGASCTVAPTCAGVGTAYLNNPWCYGIENAITVTL